MKDENACKQIYKVILYLLIKIFHSEKIFIVIVKINEKEFLRLLKKNDVNVKKIQWRL